MSHFQVCPSKIPPIEKLQTIQRGDDRKGSKTKRFLHVEKEGTLVLLGPNPLSSQEKKEKK